MTPGLRRNKELNCGAPQSYRLSPVITVPMNLVEPHEVVLYATISTWYDADIIEAAVKNCFWNGCDKVFLIDNASPDNTVEVATRAGAIVAHSYETEFYDDDLRMLLQNTFCKTQVESEKLPSVWWLNLDSDEFPCGRNGEPLKKTLSTLPRFCRTLGFNFVDLYPVKDEVYCPGRHPAEVMAWGMRRYGGVCRYGSGCNHWKHSILRYDNGVFDTYQHRGCHAPSQPTTMLPIHELKETFWMFHAPFREQETTFNRLKALCSNGRTTLDDQVTNSQGAIKRWQSLEAVYKGAWDKVDIPHTQMYGRAVKGVYTVRVA